MLSTDVFATVAARGGQPMPRPPGRSWKVGELAERTGLTVRTLHHYDAMRLLTPTGRTGSAHGSGHRLYTAEDVARLQQILSLKQLGFALEEVREYLDRADYDPREVVRLHLGRVRERVADLKRLEGRLSSLAESLEAAGAVSADQFLTTIDEMTMIEKYYTPEQLDQLKARKELVDEGRILQVQQEWVELIASVKAAIEARLDPADPKAQDLARRWFGLVNEFTCGDPGIARSLKTMYENEEQVAGMDVATMRPLTEFVGRAAASAGIKTP
jgi:DNA-binding transcriptional MerR regulator